MAWDDQHKKVAIKVIGTVESNMDYGAINYNDLVPIVYSVDYQGI